MTTHRRTWQKREQQAAALFNSRRTPGSGSCYGADTRSDSLHERLFIETKLRQRHAVITLHDDTAALARREGKTPVVVLAEKNRPGLWLLIRAEDIHKVAQEVTP